MSPDFAESHVEEATLSWFGELGYSIQQGPLIAPGEPGAERATYQDVVLVGRLEQAIAALNPHMPPSAWEEALRKLLRPQLPTLVGNNHAAHRMLVDGVEVEYTRPDGSIAGDRVRLFDFGNPEANDWLAVNQFTVIEGQFNRRPDIVIFVSGIPLAILELKNAADEDATVLNALNQLQTYKQQIPSLFHYNAALIASDGLEARVGTLTSDREWFMPWRTIEGETLAPATSLELEVLIKGLFDQRRFLAMLRHFIVFEDDGSGRLIKKMAGYHQFHAVEQAIQATITASRPGGNRQSGVIWHTQGSGKSLTMAFYAGAIAVHPAMENPTLVVITDRNDLDDQLFATFSRCHELLRQNPVQANDRHHLRQLLEVASGGVVFTTIQKFVPESKWEKYGSLSERQNIIVIADEAHRSQYDFIDGYARHMRDALPNASFIGFTGTPIELSDKNTRAVFGDYISIYDIQRAVEDKATVPIYYESRLAKLELKKDEQPKLDEQFEEVTEGEEEVRKERLKSKWAALEALVGSENRIKLVAADLLDHFELRLDAMQGKAMIVCMSRRICVELYKRIIELRPQWHSEDDDKGVIKVIMTGSAEDALDWQPHIRSKARREALAKRFKDPQDAFQIVIVRDMWLTGFDAPCLHTMYIDKPMQGHGLMQAIARVNRVFRDKPGGLVVDYLGLADQLKKALANYTESGGKGQTAIDQEEAVNAMLAKYEVCCGLFHNFDWTLWKTGNAVQRLQLLKLAQDFILRQTDDREPGQERLKKAVRELSSAFALAVPHEKALAIREDLGFFQQVRAVLMKQPVAKLQFAEEVDHAVRQIVSKAVASDQVIDIFEAAGLKKPDISILSDEFLAEVRALPQRNLALELLRKLLNSEIQTRAKKNLVQSRSFADMLQKSVRAYQNRAIETAQVIEELIKLAKDVRAADQRGEELGLSDEEVAFYDALETNDSAVAVLGDENLRFIARELVDTIRRNVAIDWTVRENVRAKLRVMVRRVLRKYGYPPDKQEKATETVMAQAELLCADWAETPRD